VAARAGKESAEEPEQAEEPEPEQAPEQAPERVQAREQAQEQEPARVQAQEQEPAQGRGRNRSEPPLAATTERWALMARHQLPRSLVLPSTRAGPARLQV
jgi:hypothetical protein